MSSIFLCASRLYVLVTVNGTVYVYVCIDFKYLSVL